MFNIGGHIAGQGAFQPFVPPTSSSGSCPSQRSGRGSYHSSSFRTPSNAPIMGYQAPPVATSTRGSRCGSGIDKGEEVSSKPRSMKKGGMVKKTGIHYLHKGEMVVPVKDVKKVKKALAKK